MTEMTEMKMKTIAIPALLFALATIHTATAQLPVVPERMSVFRDGDSVRVEFRVDIPRGSAPSGVTLIHAPLITDGKWRASLPPVVVQGRRADVAWQRHEWAADTVSRHPEAYLTRNGRAVDYVATVPFQHWMYGSRLEMETVTAGCGDTFTERTIVAGRILPPPPVPAPAPEPVVVPPPPPTTGEMLAATFSFVQPASEFDPDEPIRFYDDERDNALTIYYIINKYDIDAGYADNRQTLVNLLAAIEVIQKSEDAHIERIVVAGFASPEGPFEFNDRLAWERAVSIKEYIMRSSTMPDESIMIFNGSLDWRGLRRMVAADGNAPFQKEIVELLDSRSGLEPVSQGGLMTRLRGMGDGAVWTYLTDRVFPFLRNGAFIRVYFGE